MHSMCHEEDQIWLASGSLQVMRFESSKWYPLETGGILIGYRASLRESVITSLIGAGPRAIRTRTSFTPDLDYQERAIEQHFLLTEGSESYLGDWHSHPMGVVGLGWRDKRVLTRIAQYEPSNTPNPFMMILSKHQDWEMSIWRWYQRRIIGIGIGAEYCR